MNMKYKIYCGQNTEGEKVFYAKSDDGLFFAVIPVVMAGNIKKTRTAFSHPVIWTSHEPDIDNLKFLEAGEVLDFY